MKAPVWARRTELGMRFFRDGRSEDCPVVDAHGHMGAFAGIFFPCAGPQDMVRRMDRAGVRTVLFSHHAALSSPDLGNRPSREAARELPGRLLAYCVCNPWYPQAVAADLAGYDAGAYVGLKLHGDMHGVPYTDGRYAPAWEFADRRGLPVLVHSWGGSPRTGAEVLAAAAERYPRAQLIVGHSLHDRWQEAVDLARRFPQVFLDLCAVLDERSGVLERFVGEIGSRRVLFGTDIPWFDFHYYIAGVLAADIAEEDMRNILYRNARALFALPAE